MFRAVTFLEIRPWSTGAWGRRGDPSKFKSPLALPVLGNPKGELPFNKLRQQLPMT